MALFLFSSSLLLSLQLHINPLHSNGIYIGKTLANLGVEYVVEVIGGFSCVNLVWYVRYNANVE